MIEDFHVGQHAAFTKTFTEEDMQHFIAITGDVNPLHVDEEFARKTQFGRRVLQGMLTASILLPVLGLAVLWVSGLGAADLVGKRLPREARAALAPLLTAAVLVAMSPLALVGVRPLVLVSATLGAMTALTAARKPRRLPICICRADSVHRSR